MPPAATPAATCVNCDADPAFALAPTPGPRLAGWQTVGSIMVFAVLAVGMVWFIDGSDRILGGELVWPIPADVWAGVVFATVFLLILGAARVISVRAARGPFARDEDGPGRGTGGTIETLACGAIFLFVGISTVARGAVQLICFAGLHPAAVPAPFQVVDTTHTRAHGSDTYRLRLRYGTAGRTFGEEVGRAAYEAAREGDTLMLPVETGRFGIQRALVATPVAPGDLQHHG